MSNLYMFLVLNCSDHVRPDICIDITLEMYCFILGLWRKYVNCNAASQLFEFGES
jgi:hypothetical protein